VLAVLALPLLYVAWRAADTLVTLEQVERERDTWQRPGEVIAALGLRPGDRVVDLGSGAGYFSLRLAPVVGPAGRVIAVDVRREPLAFLWMRATWRRAWQIDLLLGDDTDPHLEGRTIDAVLIVNTYHELARPAEVLQHLSAVMRPEAHLVVADRRPKTGTTLSADEERANHLLHPGMAEEEIRMAGFQVERRDDTFIDRPGDAPWWLLVARRSP
jgi:predicted methyltransferase